MFAMVPPGLCVERDHDGALATAPATLAREVELRSEFGPYRACLHPKISNQYADDHGWGRPNADEIVSSADGQEYAEVTGE
jgi:hypothetical protein